MEAEQVRVQPLCKRGASQREKQVCVSDVLLRLKARSRIFCAVAHQPHLFLVLRLSQQSPSIS